MRRWIAPLALLAVTLTAGCGDDSTGPGDGDVILDGTLNATVAGDLGLTFRCTAAYGVQATESEDGTGLMQVQGSVTQGADTYLISIQVSHDPATGTYNLAMGTQGVAAITKNNVGNFAESGTVTFTQVSSSRMKGTFNFTAVRLVGVGDQRTVTVTQGTFDVPVIVGD
jgi:hypothetical protein